MLNSVGETQAMLDSMEAESDNAGKTYLDPDFYVVCTLSHVTSTVSNLFIHNSLFLMLLDID